MEHSLLSQESDESLVGGLPLNLKDIAQHQKGKAIVQGNSGLQFSVEVTDDKLSIDDTENHGMYFYAELVINEDTERFIKFAVCTREVGSGEQYPDLFAGQLADATISYFEGKHRLKGILFDWRDYSTNQKTYFTTKQHEKETLLQSGLSEIEAENEAKRRAAFSTRTGKRIAQKHGFNQVEISENQEVHDGEDGPETVIRGKFYKDIPIVRAA